MGNFNKYLLPLAVSGSYQGATSVMPISFDFVSGAGATRMCSWLLIANC